VTEREEKHNDIEERDTGVVLQIKGISYIEEKEKDRKLNLIEGDTLHHIIPIETRLCVEPTTLCISQRSETLSQTLVVSEESKDRNKGS
jgi:hypothetical protein